MARAGGFGKSGWMVPHPGAKFSAFPTARGAACCRIMSSQFGTLFRISTFGESHGNGIGVVVDGCPPGIPLAEADIQGELDRRRPGQSDIVTPRKEADACEILSGVFDGQTTGTPIAILVRNTDQRSQAYDEMHHTYRPSHADFTYDAKYGTRAWPGGGRASARETIGRVAAAAIAMKVMAKHFPALEIVSYVKSIHSLVADVDTSTITRAVVEENIVRAGDPVAAGQMIEAIKQARAEGNSLGGVVECVIRGVPAGLGEPVFDKLEADLAKAMLSLPATKGFELGSGFAGTLMTGRDHNDAFRMHEGKVVTTTNHSGGIQGGISNGMPIIFRVAFKPTATIMTSQPTVTDAGENTELTGRGRHDACVLPRAVPLVDAMAALVLCDHALRQRAQNG